MQGSPNWFSQLRSAMPQNGISPTWFASLFSEWRQTAVCWRHIYELSGPPREPGLYIWFSTRDLGGAKQDVLRKVGEAGLGSWGHKESDGTLYKRMARYVQGPRGGGQGRTQCELAISHYQQIIANVGPVSDREYSRDISGISECGRTVFPEQSRRKYREANKGWYRYDGAIDWALYGGPNLQDIRVVYAPCQREDRKLLRELELAVTSVADEWNRLRSLPRTLSG